MQWCGAYDIIAAEDTRHTLKLLNAYEIKKPLFACHKFNEKNAGELLIKKLEEGKNIALVSDAGMPLISDPGNILVKMLIEANQPFTVIPGPTAFVCGLILSGLLDYRFSFVGFLPEKNSDKKALLEKSFGIYLVLSFIVLALPPYICRLVRVH